MVLGMAIPRTIDLAKNRICCVHCLYGSELLDFHANNQIIKENIHFITKNPFY